MPFVFNALFLGDAKKNYSLNSPIRFVYSAAIAATETARIGAMTAVVIRTADFYTQKTSYTGVDVKNKGSLALYFLNILHLIWPFAATLFGINFVTIVF